MLLVDTVKGRVIDDDELKETYAGKQPYGEWIDRNLLNLKRFEDSKPACAGIHQGRASENAEGIWLYL